ncbi:MAG: type IV pilus assembly protein PilM [Planctomycetales bacterium]|nr:type IV pilus assembly protein PilM [Planctomycetales bacterium]
MAKSNAVWGIDIGQCAIKALRCRPHEKDEQRIVVESFDYIEYPKILSQPEAEPEELVREALEQFLSRNDLTGDRVAISVAGQSGLARFIKLPPVESKKIPDIVKYEARQQIPFALEDVVWDYQQLTGGSEEDGFALEPEVGLFAMKRDQVARALSPLETAGIEVDLIQLTPLAVYNYVCFDRLEDLQSQPYNPADPPESTVVISLGTDTTDLVVTNGYRVWQRNIPIGGSHFTKALSKELKLTFVKAEHLKRNATQADDPKAVFQAMRPVFSDLLAEIQRSLGYFSSIEKSAKIGNVIALGNAMKLPGLQRYLSQNLEQEVTPIEEFDRLSAGSASGRSQFKENVLSFAVAYGLCVQGLGLGQIRTNLLPEEIVRSRLIRSKKPWAVAGIAAILAGLTFNYMTHVSAWSETDTEAMKAAERRADTVKQTSATFKSQSSELRTAFETIQQTGQNLVSNVEGRMRWLELLKALDAAMPRDERTLEDRKETSEDISDRNEIHIEALDVQQFGDLQGEYFSLVQQNYLDARGGQPVDAAAGTGDEEGLAEAPVEEGAEGATGGLAGPGWVVELTGHHYHNMSQQNQSAKFLSNTLIKALEEGSVELPDGENGEMIQVSFADLGISHPWVAYSGKLWDEILDPEADLAGNGMGARQFGRPGRPAELAAEGGAVAEPESKLIELKRYDFIVQFCWQPRTRAERKLLVEQRQQQEAAAAEAAATAGEDAVEVSQ